MRNFRNLKIWQESILMVKTIYFLATLLPVEEKFGLRSQICRAAISIPSNIAEGCSRNSEIEFKRFLEIALGSSFELETQLYIIQEIPLITSEKIQPIIDQLHISQKMINNLIGKIKANS